MCVAFLIIILINIPSDIFAWGTYNPEDHNTTSWLENNVQQYPTLH